MSAAPACSQPWAMPADHARGHVRVERAAGEIIEEEERLRALHHHVVHAHRHEIDADRVVKARFDGDFQFRADAVVRGDEDGIAKARRLQVEETAETAERGGCPKARRRLGERFDSLHERVARVDVHARFRI